MSAKYLFLSFLLNLCISLPQAQTNMGFGHYTPDHTTPCITPTQHTAIEKEIKKNQDSLRSIGILPEVNNRGITTLFAWPLEQNNGLNDFGYHGIANNVD